MKVYNQEKTQILEQYDLTKGYLDIDKIMISNTPVPTYEQILVYKPYSDEILLGIEQRSKFERLEEITKDLAQVQAGLIVPDIENKKVEFRRLLNEIRQAKGKPPRDVEI